VSRTEYNLAKIWAARTWAEQMHGTQCYGPFLPFVYHLDRVASLLVPFGEEAVIVGYYHDILEDTKVEFHTLVQRADERVARLVQYVTDEPGRNRRERKAATNQKLAGVPPEFELALVAKAADRLANLRQCVLEKTRPQPGEFPANAGSKLDMYRREHAEFRKAVYRPGLCDQFWSEIGDILILEELPNEQGRNT
jgi:(p)ppGpp synthase/HD superfamily hydrolase